MQPFKGEGDLGLDKVNLCHIFLILLKSYNFNAPVASRHSKCEVVKFFSEIMLEMDILIPVVLLLLSVLVYFKLIQRPTDFPPGPTGIPILGNLLQMGEAPFLKFQNEWKEKYGPILGVCFGSYKTVAISDYRLIKEALSEPALAGRPEMTIWKHRSRDTQARGILFTQGEENAEQRKLAVRCLRDFGYGVKSFENLVTSEILRLLDILDETKGEPVSLKGKFHVHILSILWQVIAGTECEEDRKQLTQIFANSTRLMEENNFLTSLIMFLPWLGKYFPSLSGFSKMNSELVNLWAFLGKHIEQHKKQVETNNEEQYYDYIGAFIYEMKKATASSSFYKTTGEKNLMTSLLDLFFAGTDTMSNTLHWGTLILAINPQVQEKFHEEIDQVIGKSRLPEVNDEARMPYTQALIQEILRFSSVAPMSVFHSAMQETRFHGYKIPKNALVLLNLHGAHHDKEYWGDPEVIRPERFLSQDGKTLIKREAYFPFGGGRRVCVGEIMAKRELFLFLTTLFQKFRASPDPNNPNFNNLDPIISFILLPPEHKLVFEKRT